jgi:glycosyltransferase involved in cell wall biosynthesis
MPNKILFILKRKEDYDHHKHSSKGLSTGLYNSASFVNDMLNDLSIDSSLEIAIDNNCIDRLVTKHKPTHVIIEALWVVPSKFEVLTRLHPNVKWIIRLHSEMPFMAMEGMALDWLGDYITYPQIDISCNAPRMLEDVRTFLKVKTDTSIKKIQKRVFYLPNYYPQDYKKKILTKHKQHIDIACFGAIRPLKNQMLQAIAALKFAGKIGKKLHFHINGDRIEGFASPVLSNLKGMFQQLVDQDHQLILHNWVVREEFLKICADMDIGMQCNFSETFNIVSADLISQGVPIIGSSEIPWSTFLFNADPTSADSMCDALERTYAYYKINVCRNQYNLTKYTNKTADIWLTYFIGQQHGKF